jgi:flagellar biosynthetic protein FliO
MLLAKLNVLKSSVNCLNKACWALLVNGVISLQAIAQEEAAKTTAPLGNQASDALLPMLLALLFIVFLIYVIAWAARKMNLAPANAQHFKLISSMSLGGRERIVIIEVQGKQHAIGVTNQSVNHLFELDENIETKSPQLTDNALVNKINKVFGYQPPAK